MRQVRPPVSWPHPSLCHDTTLPIWQVCDGSTRSLPIRGAGVRRQHTFLIWQVCDGVRSYFNQALSAILLYKYERRQHRDLKESEDGKDGEGGKPLAPADIYGAEHLLRLFVKLPELLAQARDPPLP